MLIEDAEDPREPARLWGIDHGICFHVDLKLRTVIWEFAGTPLPDDLRRDLAALKARLADQGDELPRELGRLLSPAELELLGHRLNRPHRPREIYPGAGRHYPWPPV